MGEITRKDVAAQLNRILIEHGNTTAMLARATLSALFVWTMQMGLVDHNPIIGTVKISNATRERTLDDDELASIWRACADDDYGRVVRILILTGCRRQVGSMKWDEIADGKWRIPAERALKITGRTSYLYFP